MFFTLSHHKDNRLPCHTMLGTWWLSHDHGWYSLDNGMGKGYVENFVEITLSHDVIKLSNDTYRSFPLWWNGETQVLSNLLGTGIKVWADDAVEIVDNTLFITKKNILPTIDNSSLTMDQAVDKIADILVDKIQYLNTGLSNIPKKLFVTGGIDTVMLHSLVKYCNVECEILDYEHFEYDYFTNVNIQELREKHWAYKQIHHWREPTVLITGSCGDEFFMRGPYTIGLWAAWHGIKLSQLLNNRQGYHVGYYLQEKNLKLFDDFYFMRNRVKENYPSYQDLVKQILNANSNDHQHWHLGNTITFTPLKNLEFTEIILRLSPDDLIEQIVDASVNRRLIDKFYPASSKLLSTTKNTNNREFLTGLLGV